MLLQWNTLLLRPSQQMFYLLLDTASDMPSCPHALQKQTISILRYHCSYKAHPNVSSESPALHFKPSPSCSIYCDDF